MWRPKNWKNPYSIEDTMKHLEYENMADSILEALKTEGVWLNIPKGYVYNESALQMFCETLADEDGLRDWIIFIPEKREHNVEGHLSGGFRII